MTDAGVACGLRLGACGLPAARQRSVQVTYDEMGSCLPRGFAYAMSAPGPAKHSPQRCIITRDN